MNAENVRSEPWVAAPTDKSGALNSASDPVRSGVGGATVKRYWSTLTPLQLERMTKEEIIEAKKFDAKLTQEDLLEMQTIDADCNDCRHFKRGVMRKGLGIACFEGHCLKFDKPTLAWPMQFSGHECFEHRRAPSRSFGRRGPGGVPTQNVERRNDSGS